MADFRLKGGYYEFRKKNIQWVVSVPAIWNEYGKQFMKSCAQKAGLNDITIVLEPEATTLTFIEDIKRKSESGFDYLSKFLQKGKIFMLIDAGGYTLDITLNQFIDDFWKIK